MNLMRNIEKKTKSRLCLACSSETPSSLKQSFRGRESLELALKESSLSFFASTFGLVVHSNDGSAIFVFLQLELQAILAVIFSVFSQRTECSFVKVTNCRLTCGSKASEHEMCVSLLQSMTGSIATTIKKQHCCLKSKQLHRPGNPGQ